MFPSKLWKMLNDSENKGVMWNEQGDGIVLNKALIEKEFLSLNGFKATSLASFVRQLNCYGFKKSVRSRKEKTNILHYSHPNVKKDQPELLPLMKRFSKKPWQRIQRGFEEYFDERWRRYRNLENGEDDDSEPFEPDVLVPEPWYELCCMGVQSHWEHPDAWSVAADHSYAKPYEMENEEIVVEMATDEADFQLEIPSVSTVLVEEQQEEVPEAEPLHDFRIGDWVTVKGGDHKKEWEGPHQVLQTSYSAVLIAKGSTWMDISKIQRA